MSPRDSQRSRVYRAETPLGGRRLPSWPTARRSSTKSSDRCGGWPGSPTATCSACTAPAARARRAAGLLPRGVRRGRRSPSPAATARPASCSTSSRTGRWPTRPTSRTTAARSPGSCSTPPPSSWVPAKRERLAAGYTEHKVHIGRPPRRSPDGGFDYAWDERLRLGRGRDPRACAGVDEANARAACSRHGRITGFGSAPRPARRSSPSERSGR